MRELRVTLETVTPLFIGGAEPRGTKENPAKPELRPPSFRGAMRYWLRAALGGVIGDDLATLKRTEADVFGSTEGTGAVSIRLTGELAPQKHDFSKARYLFFSLKGRGEEPDRQCLRTQPDNPIKLQLWTRQRETTFWNQACGALWLLLNLGGIGSRSRRGTCILKAVKVEGEWPQSLPRLTERISTTDGLKAYLERGIQGIRDLQQGSSHPRAGFDVLHPDYCEIAVVNRTWQDPFETLEEISKFLSQERRSYAGKEFPKIVKRSNPLPEIPRSSLGLPIVFFDPRKNRSVGTLQGEEHDRRASPLWIHVSKLENRTPEYIVVLTVFHSPLLPDKEQLALKDRERIVATGPAPDTDWISNTLLKRLGQQIAPLLEVKYK